MNSDASAHSINEFAYESPVCSPEARLTALFQDVAARALGGSLFDPMIRPSKHADFQMNGAMSAAKTRGQNPRQLAEQLLAELGSTDVLETAKIAGPGFVNCKISPTYLEQELEKLLTDNNNGIPQTQSKYTYVIDYASPNIAKSMHVGHLRTCIIGDAFVRVLTALGHEVIRQDHQGDWGTQFGMLIEHLIDSGDPEAAANAALHDLDGLYREARKKFDTDEAFAQRSRERVVQLQAGEPETHRLWQILVDTSRTYFAEEYEKLGVQLTEEDARGESFYNDMLDETVEELVQKGLAKEDDGALCVYPDGYTGRDGKPFAFIIRKRDGGYNYATTDLATVKYSIDALRGNHLLYVTDVRQSQHFNMVFVVAKAAGWIPQNAECKHIGYGAVTDADGRPFKSRSGETVRLGELLDEAITLATQALSDRVTISTDEERAKIARAVGIGAVKWADLKNECKNNYVFDFDRMLAFQGNTGPYVQYASTRAKSVLRKAAAAGASPGVLTISEEAERQLAITLLSFGDAVLHVAEQYEPHHLCAYLFELAERFTSFYENCPILKDEQHRASRLKFCVLTANVLDRGLNLLGIDTVDHM